MSDRTRSNSLSRVVVVLLILVVAGVGALVFSMRAELFGDPGASDWTANHQPGVRTDASGHALDENGRPVHY